MINATLSNATAAVEIIDPNEGYEWWRFALIVLLSFLSAVFSGMNLGIVGLDPGYLELLTMGPFETKLDERNAVYAQRILPLRKRGNLLICTILLGNVAANSILSILMADLTSGLAGMLISTVIVLIFGEILPQSLFARHALVVGAHTIWILYIFVFLLFPISFPLSAILDKLLGEDAANVYNKNKMKRLFELYEKEQLLDPQERKMLTAALELNEKKTFEVMTPLDQAFMLDIDSPVDKELLRTIY
jgi:metal transporter CNNM